MLATAMRFVGWRGGVMGLATTLVSDLCVFIAFLLGARVMVVWSGGHLPAGRGLREQIRLAHQILLRVFLLLVAMTAAFSFAGGRALAPYMMLGFDGIAFDQFSKIGMVWSSALAAIILLMAVEAEQGRRVTLIGALRDLVSRAGWMVPAIAAVVVVQLCLSALQGAVRGGVHALWLSGAPGTIKNFVYFGFVFGFASVRVWATLFVMTLALRQSWQPRKSGLPAASE